MFGEPGQGEDLLGPNYYSELVASFAGIGPEGRETPTEATLADQPAVDEAAGAIPVAAFFDESSGGDLDYAVDFFTFGGGGGGR